MRAAPTPDDVKTSFYLPRALLRAAKARAAAEGISLRGTAPSLIVSGAEAGTYTEEEGAFYGNIFADVAEGEDLEWFACRGSERDARVTTVSHALHSEFIASISAAILTAGPVRPMVEVSH